MFRKVINRKFWTIVAVVTLVLLAAQFFYINQRVDVTGGTSLIYQIDTNRLEKEEICGLSNKTINLLRKRIDPDNYLHLVWIPKGESMFEVRIPLPGKKVKRKYEIYREAKLQLKKADINPDEALWYYAIDEIPESIKKDQAKLNAIKKYNSALKEYIPYLGIYNPRQNNFDPDYIKYEIAKTGYLEFRILPTIGCPEVSINEIEKYTEMLKANGPEEGCDERYIWCRIRDVSSWVREYGNGQMESKIADEERNHAIIESYENEYYVLACNESDKCMLHTPNVKWEIEEVSPTKDPMGRPAVSFVLDENGGKLLAELTKNNLGRPLCILLDNVALSAPVVRDRISRYGIISGRFTPSEIDDIVNYLSVGTLPAKIVEKPISEEIIE